MPLRRTLGTLLAALGLVLAPTAAVAYPGGPDDVVVSDSNPAPGEPFNVVVDGGANSDENTLTVTSQDPDVPSGSIEIAGTQSMTKAATGGVSEFTVTLNVEGRYTLVGFDEAGNRVGSSVVVVGDGVAGEPSGDAGDDGAGTSAGGTIGGLGATGATSGTMLLGGAGLLLLAGGGALLYTRRRGTKETA